MKKTGIRLVVSVLIAMSLVFMFSRVCSAEPKLRFRSVHFTPHPVFTGETTRISIRFSIEEGPINLTASVEQTPRSPGPPPPTIIIGTFNTGDHTADVYRYTVPSAPPERVCFNIKITGGELMNVCFKRMSGSGGRLYMDVESSGNWVESITTPAPAPSAEKPDLRIAGNLAIDDVLRIENIGRGTAYNIRAVKECFVEGRWVRSGGEFGETRMLGPGHSVPVRIGKLGRSLGPCPSGTTKVRVVVDPRNELAEMDENNNIVEASTLADLRIIDFRIEQTDLGVRGSSVVVGYGLSFELSNTGVGDAGPFVWEVSVFRDGSWGSFFGERVHGLASGKKFSKTKIDVSRSVRKREQVRLRIDPLNEVPETNEDDNMRESVVRN